MAAQEIEVLEANAAFYRAFAERDAVEMARLWAERAPVACVHPGWDALDGREEVLRSWRDILSSPAAPEIRCTQAAARVLGDFAYVVCHEVLPSARLVATNLFVREGGRWRMVHHQASPLAPGQARPVGPTRGPAN